MIGSIDIEVQAHNPQFPLCPVNAVCSSPQNLRIRNVPRSIGKWKISKVYVSATYPDESVVTGDCVLTGGVWCVTIDGCDTAGTSNNGLIIYADGIDENGDEVTGYILGMGDIVILTQDGRVLPQEPLTCVNLKDTQPSNPKKGDAYFNSTGNLLIYNGTSWSPTFVANIPTKTSQLVNDSEFISYQKLMYYNGDWRRNIDRNWYENDEKCYIKKVVVYYTVSGYTQTRTANLEWNETEEYFECSYIQALGFGMRYEITDGTSGILSFMNEDGSEELDSVVTFGRFSDVEVDSSIVGKHRLQVKLVDEGTPDKFMLKSEATTKTSQLTNDSGFITSSDIPTIGNAKVTVKQGTVVKGTFNLNGTSDKFVLLDAVPTKTSQLTNDSGFMTSTDVVPQGTGTEVIATIGGKEIKAPAGGGGGDGKCLLFLSHRGNSGQYVQWTSGGHVYKIGKSSGFLNLYIDGVEKGMPQVGLNNIMIPVEGSVFINDDGYSGDCFVFLDEQKVSSTWVSHDTTGKQSMTVSFGECLEQGTLILMADGTQKTVSELVDGDKVACINPYTGELDEDEVTSCDGGTMKFHNKTDKWTFADGTILKTVHPHQFFNVRTGKMEYIADFQIGDEVRKNDGTTTALVSHEVINGIVFHNTLYTKNYNNYFANGILTGNRKSVKWGWYWIEQNQ